jgi:hypothetical protein
VTALEITSRIRVRADPQRVWDLAMDWSRQHEWVPATVVHGGTGVGAQVAARTGFGPAAITDTMVITEWEPPRRCVVRHTGRVVRGGGVFEVAAHGEFSEFTWTELLDLPVPAVVRPAATAVGRWTLAPAGRLILDYTLRRFARLV